MIIVLTTQAFRRHYVNLGEPTHQAVNHKIKLLRKDMGRCQLKMGSVPKLIFSHLVSINGSHNKIAQLETHELGFQSDCGKRSQA